jgi:hypothetical protein
MLLSLSRESGDSRKGKLIIIKSAFYLNIALFVGFSSIFEP